MLCDNVTAPWLRSLVDRGLLQGEVCDADVRTMRDPPPTCHFFAGIGGWPLALGDLPCWTVGKGLGVEDPRDLWPVMRGLIARHRPALVFGEQVDNVRWIERWRADVEPLGYTTRATRLAACLAGAPHRRYRWFWGMTLGEWPRVPLMPAAWANGVRVECRDGKMRRLGATDPEPRKNVRGYGNAIVPQLVGRWLAGEWDVAPEFTVRWDGERVHARGDGFWPTPRAQEPGCVAGCLPTGRSRQTPPQYTVAGVARWLMGFPRGWLP
jgi:site-specific DNA-cytosine methylase